MASVAEVKAAIDAALQQVSEAQAIMHAAVEKVGEAQQSLAAAMEGSGHDAVAGAQAALQQATTELDDFFGATQNAIEQAQAYGAAL